MGKNVGLKRFKEDFKVALNKIEQFKKGSENLDEGEEMPNLKLSLYSDKGKKLNLTIDTTGVNNQGDFEQELVTKAILGGFMLSNNLCMVQENFTYKQNITTFEFDAVLNPYNCKFTAAGSAKASDIVLEPVRFEIAYELCTDDIRNMWQALRLQGIITGNALVPEVEDALIFYMSQAISKGIDQLMWQGDTSGSTGTLLDEVDGFIKLLADAIAAGGGVEPIVVPTPATIDDSNIIAELKKTYKLIPSEFYEKSDVTMYMNRKHIQDMKIAMMDDSKFVYLINAVLLNRNEQDIVNPYNFENRIIPFLYDPSVRLAGIDEMPIDTFVATYSSNLWAGRLASGETDSINIVDMSSQADDTWRFKMTSSIDVAIAFTDQCVTYGITATP